MKIKTIIFDFDGTIANTFSLALKACNLLSEEYGYKKVDEKEYIRLKNQSTLKIITEGLGLSLYQIPFFLKKFKNLMNTERKKYHYLTV